MILLTHKPERCYDTIKQAFVGVDGLKAEKQLYVFDGFHDVVTDCGSINLSSWPYVDVDYCPSLNAFRLGDGTMSRLAMTPEIDRMLVGTAVKNLFFTKPEDEPISIPGFTLVPFLDDNEEFGAYLVDTIYNVVHCVYVEDKFEGSPHATQTALNSFIQRALQYAHLFKDEKPSLEWMKTVETGDRFLIAAMLGDVVPLQDGLGFRTLMEGETLLRDLHPMAAERLGV